MTSSSALVVTPWSRRRRASSGVQPGPPTGVGADSPPKSSGATASCSSSTCPASSRAATSVLPPSTIRCSMPRSVSAPSAAARSTRSSPWMSTITPRPSSQARVAASVRVVVQTTTCPPPASRNSLRSGSASGLPGRPMRETTATLVGCDGRPPRSRAARKSGSRTVRPGSSPSSVRPPTITASAAARSWSTRALSAAPEMRAPPRATVSILPSAVMAMLTSTCGRVVTGRNRTGAARARSPPTAATWREARLLDGPHIGSGRSAQR